MVAEMGIGSQAKRFSSWLPVLFFMGLAAVIRWRMNFAGLMPGVNGPYYPVQVRALLETGRLGFPDFPLVFWLEALVAKLLFALKMGTLSECIMWASKGVDALFPTLVAVPAYLLARTWAADERRRLWGAWVVAAFSILFLFALFMTADLQKNSVGNVWLFFYIYYLYQALRQGGWRPLAIAGVFFVLTALTHIGCFGVAIVFLLVVAVVSLLLEPARRRMILRGAGFLLLLLVGATVVLYLFFDPERVERLLTVFLLPAELFEQPMLSTPLSPFNAPPLVVGNLMAIAGVILLIRRWASAEPARRLIVLAAVLLAFLLSSPVFGQEWATRLSIMAHIPATVVLAFLLADLQSRVATFSLTAGVLILLLFSVMVSSGPGFRAPGISEASYEELHQLRGVIARPGETLVLARHGLEWWAAWVLETDVGQRPDLGPEVWDEYGEVLYLEQIAGAAGFGPAGGGPLGPPFPEVRIPPDAELLFEGRHFRLARVTPPPEGWYPPR